MSVVDRRKRDKGNHRRPYQVLYRDGSGARRSKQFRLRKDAEAWAHRTGVDVSEGVHTPESETVTVREAGDRWLASVKAAGLERSTYEQYEQHLRLHLIPLLGAVKLSALNVPRIRTFSDALREDGRSPAMVRKVLSSLSTLLKDAQEQGLTTRNPVRDMKRQRHTPSDRDRLQVGRDIPAPPEIKQIVDAAQGRWRPMLITAIFTGVRSSELRAIRWTDIDLAGAIIHIRQRVDRFGQFGPPKSKAGNRSIPLPPIVVNTLREWRLACPKGPLGLAFPNASGGMERHTYMIEKGLLPTLVAAGLAAVVLDGKGKPKIRGRYTGLHSLRHFYASWCINRRADGGLELPAKSIQVRLGHSTIGMLMDTYGHLFPQSDDREALAAGERALLG